MLPRTRTTTRPSVIRTAVAAAAAVAVTLPVAWSVTDSGGAGRSTGEQVERIELAAGGNPVTPGDFRGYGFDQCLAPSQEAMNRWMQNSPFLAAGIYISGSSRGCRSQPNLTPTWIRNNLRNGWKLLPITLGPQASCHPGFPRYNDDRKIDPSPGAKGLYGDARRQGWAEAEKTVRAARRLGIAPRSTLWYDLEGFDIRNTRCRQSALAFLSAWTVRLHRLGYVSGVYSSAGSGIRALDDLRVRRTKGYTLPDQIWIARWDGVANTSTSYIREDGWRPGGRMKQYRGGHRETWGGVTINIDSNYAQLGRGMYAPPERRCGGVRLDHRTYPVLQRPRTGQVPPAGQVRALQCLLREKGYYRGNLDGKYWASTRAAAKAWQRDRGFAPSDTFWRDRWVAILSQGSRPALKYGSAGGETRRIQRALNAADPMLRRPIHGRYGTSVKAAVRTYQRKTGMKVTGIVNRATWKKLQAGRR
jgi:hypothetical protein